MFDISFGSSITPCGVGHFYKEDPEAERLPMLPQNGTTSLRPGWEHLIAAPALPAPASGRGLSNVSALTPSFKT